MSIPDAHSESLWSRWLDIINLPMWATYCMEYAHQSLYSASRCRQIQHYIPGKLRAQLPMLCIQNKTSDSKYLPFPFCTVKENGAKLQHLRLLEPMTSERSLLLCQNILEVNWIRGFCIWVGWALSHTYRSVCTDYRLTDRLTDWLTEITIPSAPCWGWKTNKVIFFLQCCSKEGDDLAFFSMLFTKWAY